MYCLGDGVAHNYPKAEYLRTELLEDTGINLE